VYTYFMLNRSKGSKKMSTTILIVVRCVYICSVAIQVNITISCRNLTLQKMN